MRPSATSVCGLELLVFEAFSYSASSLRQVLYSSLCRRMCPLKKKKRRRCCGRFAGGGGDGSFFATHVSACYYVCPRYSTLVAAPTKYASSYFYVSGVLILLYKGHRGVDYCAPVLRAQVSIRSDADMLPYICVLIYSLLVSEARIHE